jgi:small nuclear ribonucleoprotein (snRNP)-like protein
MIRQILSLFLVSILIIQAVPVSAQDVDSIPTLEERLSNMEAEVKRFLDPNTANSSGLLLEQETRSTDESAEAVRAKLLSLEPGTKIRLVLLDGETVQGRLVEVTDDAFLISAEIDKNQYVRREFSFDQVEALENYVLPEKVQEIPVDKRVEVVLFNGEKIRGRVLGATEQGFTLSLEGDEYREFTFDEVKSVRKLGMRTINKILIGVGIFCALMVIGYIGALRGSS